MDQVKIGAFIAQLRREKGWTQEELGERLGITNKTVSRWENGNYMPSIEMLSLLGKEFGVSLNELVEGRRLEEEDFRAAADRNLACAMESPMDRFWKWLERYGAFAAMTILLCCIIGMLIYAFYQYRWAHPEDVSPVGTWAMYSDLADQEPGIVIPKEYIVLDRNGTCYFYRQFEPLEKGVWETWDGTVIRITVGDRHRDMVLKSSDLYAFSGEGTVEWCSKLSANPVFINVHPEDFDP